MMFSSRLFKLEFTRSLKSLITWSLSIGLTMVFVIVLYPMVIDIYSAIPAEYQAFLDAFGGVPHNVVEYYATEGVMMLQLFGGIFAALEGYNALNRDDKEKTVECIYQLPYSRTAILTTKLVKVIVNVLVFSIVVYFMSILSFLVIGESYDGGDFLLFNVYNTIMFLMLAILGFVLVVFMKPTQKSMGAIAFPFVFYIISVISSVTNNETLELLKHVTPFTFANPVDILKLGADFEWISFVVFTGLSILLTVAAYWRFQKRELTV